MPDIVGTSCVLCQQTIASLFDGAFCPDCGGPYHHACFGNQPKEPSRNPCSYCKGDKTDVQAIVARQDRRAGVIAVNSRECPSCKTFIPKDSVLCPCGFDFDQTVRVAAVCPKCGDTKYRTRRPNRWIAFVQDRICKSCKTQYAPPTPLWAGIVFILVGLLLGGVFGVSGALRILPSANPIGLPGLIFDGALALLGLLAILHGIRRLVLRGKA